MKLYILLRDEGLQTDGYYYESSTNVLGVFDDRKKASEALIAICNLFHPKAKELCDTSDFDRDAVETYREYAIDRELNDVFWIEEAELNGLN